MQRKFILLYSILFFTALSFVFIFQPIANAQFSPKDDHLHFSGSIENDSRMTGFFRKNNTTEKDLEWCVFVGENGQIYRLSLIEKNIHQLFIDGKKVEDSQIWKHTAEYKPFLTKYWREQEIEKEEEELEAKEKPLEKRADSIDNEIDKLDEELEKFEDKIERGSTNFVDTRKNLKTKIKQLTQELNDLQAEMDKLSDLQDNLSDEQDLLNLHRETEKVLQKIVEDLESIGAIKTRKNLSFKLSNFELIVNNQKASPEMFQLLKAKYIFDSETETGFVYRWKGKI